MVFESAGEQKMFISSADWMTRNMDYRIEVGCPIYDKDLKVRIMDILNLQLRDTIKARIIDQTQNNQYVARGNRKKLRSQTEIYRYLKALEKDKNAKH
jgi:polyphosphate kinase